MFHFETALVENLKLARLVKASIFGLAALALLTPAAALAKGGSSGGGSQIGIQLGATASSQEQINTLISRANTRVGGITTGALNSAYEASVDYGYRFDGTMIAILLRPSYFYEKTTGSGTGGGFNYGVTGFSVFPMLRIYPLENDFLKFFLQVGVGYGKTTSSIEEAGSKVEFSGDAFGSMAGLGAEFCFAANHCAVVESNYRYVRIERNIATSSTGSFASNSLSQYANGQEVELDGSDLGTRMSGLQFLGGYTYRF